MGFFGNNKTPNRNGLLNKIANPNADPNSGGLFGRIGSFSNSGGLFGRIFNRGSNNQPTINQPNNEPTNFQDNNKGGGTSW